MDHNELLSEIRRHMDESSSLMRADLKELDNKLDGYQERLIKVESTLGFIKAGLLGFVSIVVSAVGYIINKYLDLLK